VPANASSNHAFEIVFIGRKFGFNYFSSTNETSCLFAKSSRKKMFVQNMYWLNFSQSPPLGGSGGVIELYFEMKFTW
jgi:hypothetical protein